MEIYPLTITMDRYGGTYSKGEYLAWRLDAWEVPTEPFEDDVSCMVFWSENKILVGIGNTPESAVENLERKLLQKAVYLHKEYGGVLQHWVDAVEICDDDNSAREYVIRRSGVIKG